MFGLEKLGLGNFDARKCYVFVNFDIRKYTWCKIFTVSNCPFTHGVKLSFAKLSWCQIVWCQIVWRQIVRCQIVPVPNCLTIIKIFPLFVFVSYLYLSCISISLDQREKLVPIGRVHWLFTLRLCWQLMPLTPLSNARLVQTQPASFENASE